MTKYNWKTKPYAHQVKAVKTLLRNGYGGALLMEPRTGKSKTTVDWLSILASAGKINRAVIICPARVIDVWVEQFHLHSPLMVNVVIWDAKARRSGYMPPINGAFDLTVLITNYEAFATPGRTLKSGRRSTTTGRFKHRQLLLKWVAGKPAACVLDESHKIKSPSGKASNMVQSLGKSFQYRAILTGTPVTKAKRIHDLYMQWKFLNPARLDELDITTVRDMKDFTGVWQQKHGYEQWLRGRERNLVHLRRAIHKDSFAVKRSDCFDLPPVDRQEIFIKLSPKTARLYDKMATEMVAQILHNKETHTVEASIQLVQGLRLRQITGGVATTDEGKLIRVGREKLDALELLLEEIAEHDEKVVIAANFKADLNAIVRAVKKYDMACFQLRGGMKREDATDGIRQFKRLDSAGAFVMQPQAGALGIDLSTASRMIWYSLTPSWVNWTQSCDRIALSRKSTTFTYLTVPGTVDQVLYKTLLEDTDMGKLILEQPELLLRKK